MTGKKLCIILLMTFFFTGCKEVAPAKAIADESIVIRCKEVFKDELVLNQLEGKWYYKGEPYNGYSLKLHPNGMLGEKLGFYKGKREGLAQKWSENGVLRMASNYRQNRLVGKYKSWWENGVRAAESYYVNGNLDGDSKEWYPTGKLAKERRLANGKEEGLQKAWLQNGKLYVNYEAKNGRIFGMKRANSCYKLQDEVVVRDE